ncbi:hypothetical protein C8Q72DRAFT_559130 [Fomitopsis betulina]|nr:hypothetical protein C8Q72DRAFT_559130 [Fomitopsis betulina]
MFAVSTQPRWLLLSLFLVFYSWAKSGRHDPRWSLFGIAVEAQLNGLSSCATNCANSASTTAGCEPLDMACACVSSSFLSSAESCMSSNCDASDAQQGSQILESICGVGKP